MSFVRFLTFFVAAGAVACSSASTTSGNPANPGDTQDDAGAPSPDEDAGPAPVTPACHELDPRTVPVTVTVQPDQGEAPIVQVLQKAQKSLRVYVYQMGKGGTQDALIAKAKAGVDVRVIFDNANQDVNGSFKTALDQAGARTMWSDPQFTYTHAKVIVVDDAEAVVSTGNWSLNYIQQERNYVADVQDAADVQVLAALFDADWGKTSPDLSCTRMLVSPVNSKARLLALINSATKTLEIESMQFAETDVRAAVVARKKAGVDVRVLLAAPSWITANTDAGAYLKQNGVPAKWLSFPEVHVKAMVVDGARAYLGSENLSFTSLTRNREVGLVVTESDVLGTMGKTFEADWAKATSF